MEATTMVVMALIAPVLLFPAAFVWYLTIGGMHAAVREAREKRAAA